MKVLAKRNFRNPGRRLALEGSPHPDHVPKGAELLFGAEDTPYEKLTREDRALVYELNAADCLCEATAENAAKIAAELAEERKRNAQDPGTHPIFSGATAQYK